MIWQREVWIQIHPTFGYSTQLLDNAPIYSTYYENAEVGDFGAVIGVGLLCTSTYGIPDGDHKWR